MRGSFYSSSHYSPVTFLLLPLLNNLVCSSAEYAGIKINIENLKTLLVGSGEVHMYVFTRCNTAWLGYVIEYPNGRCRRGLRGVSPPNTIET